MKTDISFNVEPSGSLTNNLNYLAPLFFRMTLDKLKFPNVEYTVQTVVLPDVTVQPAQYATPQRRLPVAGDKAEFGELQISFLIDEDMKNYQEIYDWMIAEVVNEDPGNRKERDLTLSILSSHNNVNREIQFVDAFPTSLSSLPFDITITDTQYLTAVVGFSFAYFKMI